MNGCPYILSNQVAASSVRWRKNNNILYKLYQNIWCNLKCQAQHRTVRELAIELHTYVCVHYKFL